MADDQNPQLPLGDNGSDGKGDPTGAASIIPINIEEEMRRSYLDYSMSVIIGRALPDVRDGFKPVHRRVLYTMHEMGLQHNKKYTKCAKIVGQAMGVFHPHGDAPIYDTLVRMAQPFSLRYPMVDGQGNFGSVDGDPPAAMRYTEAPHDARCRRDAGRHRAGDRRLHAELRRVDPRAPLPAHAHSQPHRQRIERHRCWHGDQHSAAQFDRGRQRRHRDGEQSARRPARSAQACAGSRLPHRRIHLRHAAASPRLTHRARQAS